ncbi:MAG: tRNA-binding protein [Neisseriaceae bacterium]
MELIKLSDFEKIDIRIGQIISAKLNEKALIPAYILAIDFGDLGIKTSSAQLTQNYTETALIGRKICAVVNFPTKRVAGIKSEVLVLASICKNHGTLLLHADNKATNGSKIF